MSRLCESCGLLVPAECDGEIYTDSDPYLAEVRGIDVPMTECANTFRDRARDV